MQKFYIYITLIILVLLSACSKNPKHVIPEEKMVDVLYDIQLAQVIYRNKSGLTSEEQRDAIVAGVLDKHKITQAQLDTSLIWYADNLKTYIRINDSVVSKLRSKNNILTAEINAISEARRVRTSRLIPSIYYLDKASPILSFNIDSIKLKTIDIPSFYLSFDVFGLLDSQKVNGALYYTYRDTIIRQEIPISENTHYSLDKPNKPDSLLKGIAGYIFMDKYKEGLPNSILLYNINYLDSTRTIKDSLSIDMNNISPDVQINKEEPTPAINQPVAEEVKEAVPIEEVPHLEDKISQVSDSIRSTPNKARTNRFNRRELPKNAPK